MGLFAITPAERNIIQKIVTDTLNKRIGSSSQGRPRRNRLHQSGPITYIASPNATGVSALDDSVDPNEPGQGVCDIYQIRDTDTGPELIDMQLEEVVYNLTTSDLEEGTWISINRDNYGKWIANVSAAGARIIFDITSVALDCKSASVTVVAGPCDGSPAIGDNETVYDEAGCFFDIPKADLIGLRGFASKYKVDKDGVGTGYPDTECRWVVDSLCCGELI